MWTNDKEVKNIKPDLDKGNYESLNDILGIKLPKIMVLPKVIKIPVPEKIEKVMVELEELPDNLQIIKRENIGITFWNLVRLLFGGTMRFDLCTTEKLTGLNKKAEIISFITIRKGNYCRRG